ncbi:mucin-5AC [Gadus morhua]|uniref:mucin-5AC n=1 Tax=Gadus morhua TaxID=8049 RepID=UPI0011B5F635|nr:mucin-5AC-like [Gadus morhua]XP_030217168.1 mucin-5AC-like [Gadus morhua]
MKSSSTLLLLTLLSLLVGVPAADPSSEGPDSSPSNTSTLGGSVLNTSAPDPSPSDLTTQEDPSASNQTSDGPGSSPTPEYSATDGPTPPPSSVLPAHTSTTAKPTTATTERCMFPRTQGRVVLMVAGALTVACVGLLVTTALLTWKLCQRRREAEPDSDLISNSEFWMGSARRNKAKPPPANDTCLLLGHLETKGGQRGAEGGDGGEAGEEQEGKGGEGEVDVEANGTAGVLAPAGGPSESGPPADPCLGGGSGEAV